MAKVTAITDDQIRILLRDVRGFTPREYAQADVYRRALQGDADAREEAVRDWNASRG